MKRYIFLLALIAVDFIANAQNPIRLWSFDSQISDSLVGNKELVEGISGKALLFDGYQTEVIVKSENVKLTDDFTLTAWVAPQEYSWNESAFINQQKGMDSGFFFGINDLGKLVGSVAVNQKWITCISLDHLPLLKWSHVTMVVKSNIGISLYINGRLVGNTPLHGKPTFADEIELHIGKTQSRQIPAGIEPTTGKAVRTWMYFDGLIDELQVFNKALTLREIGKMYRAITVKNEQPLQYRRLPSGTDETRPFGAYYTKLSYASGWDSRWRGSDIPDVIVRFGNENSTKLVFWRGTGYIPALVTENDIWMTDQSVENFGTGECYEAMGDKQCRYSNVRIVENTPARVVIHWRYALAGIKYQIFEETEERSGDWVDEYWTAYPDGVIVRNQILWSDFQERFIKSYQFQETIFFNQPGTRPEDNVEYEAISFVDMEGNKATYSWENGAPKSFDTPKYKPIQLTNTKSEYKPYGIYYPERITFPFKFGWTEGYTTFPCWNHWPVAQIASDGRNSKARDKVSHSSLTQVNCNRQIYERRADGSVRVRSIMGMTNRSVDSLLPLARSWNYAADVKNVTTGFSFDGYDAYQRSYKFKKIAQESTSLTFDVCASESSPIVNMALEIENWGNQTAKVVMNDKECLPGIDYLIGYIPSLEGDKIVLWIYKKATENVNLKIHY